MIPNNNIKSTIFLSLLIIFGFSIKAQQNIKFGNITYNNAVNISGKQQMLSQKMSKAYLYLISNPMDAKAKKEMLRSKILFERQNSFLLQNSRNKIITANIKKTNKLFIAFKELIETTPGYDNAKKITDLNNDLLIAVNQMTSSIANESKFLSLQIYVDEKDLNDKIELHNMINASSRQRMLSERLALYYYASFIVPNKKEMLGVLNNTCNELEGTLTTLKTSPINTPLIDQKIKLAIVKWDMIKNQKEELLDQQLDETDVYKLSDELTVVFNEIANLYDKTKIKSSFLKLKTSE